MMSHKVGGNERESGRLALLVEDFLKKAAHDRLVFFETHFLAPQSYNMQGGNGAEAAYFRLMRLAKSGAVIGKIVQTRLSMTRVRRRGSSSSSALEVVMTVGSR